MLQSPSSNLPNQALSPEQIRELAGATRSEASFLWTQPTSVKVVAASVHEFLSRSKVCLSGLRNTSLGACQALVAPDHRSGFFCLAAS